MADHIDRPTPADLPPPAPSSISPETLSSYRSQLTRGEDIVDPATWAGSIPQVHGIAPRVRVGHSRWFNLLWLLPIGFVLLIVAVAVAQGLRGIPSVQRFIAHYPGAVQLAGAQRNAGFPSGWRRSTSSTCS